MFSQKLKLLRKRDELSQIRFAIDIGFSQASGRAETSRRLLYGKAC